MKRMRRRSLPHFTAPRDKTYEARIRRTEANDVIERDEVVLFWGGWASQWYPAQFTIGNVTYNSAEQYMMAEKARAMGDEATLKKILRSKYAKGTKELGRQVSPWDQRKWSARKAQSIIYKGNLAKFSQNPALKAALLATGTAKIGEASPYDDVYGIGVGIDHKDAFRPARWRGSNWLGKALMRVRATLRRRGGAKRAAASVQKKAMAQGKVGAARLSVPFAVIPVPALSSAVASTVRERHVRR